MDKEKLSLLMKKIEEAELVLIGIGEEWEINKNDWEKTQKYGNIVNKLGEENLLLPFVKKALIDANVVENIDIKEEFYQNLLKLVKDKNYFIVSLCTDGLIKEVGFNDERIVEPCGNYSQLQCSNKCTTDLYVPNNELMLQIKKLTEEELDLSEVTAPICPNCGSPLVYNNVDLGSNYVEEGYLKQWQKYTKWLQGTVNRRVCILELGVGMKFPTVIRWPFEKVTFFNEKASFFRVHSRLYQITEEIKERSYGIGALPEEFSKELSNSL